VIFSINDKIREKLFEKKTVESTLSIFNNLGEEDKVSVLKLLLLDYAKVIAIELDDIDAIKRSPIFKYPIEYIINLCMCSNGYLTNILKGAFDFYSSGLVSKCIAIESMEAIGVEDLLLEVSRLHILDKISYTFSYDLEDFKLYFLDSVEKNIVNGYSVGLTVEFLKDKLKDLTKFDCKKYESYILECIREYYKWNLFKKEGLSVKPEFPDNYEYLDMIKKAPFYSLIASSIYSDEFLTIILLNYLHYSTLGDKTIENDVNKFFLDNSDKKLQKKLKIKRD